jgi:signal transduction histidine kinase
VIRTLKADERTKYCAMILITSTSRRDGYREAIDAGADGFINKDEDLEFLQIHINDMMRAHHLYKEVSEAKSKIEEQVLAFKSFSSRVAHDLRSPLSVIISLTDMMKGNSLDSSEMPKIVGMLHENSLKAMNIIEGIYELSGLTGKGVSFSGCRLQDMLDSMVLSFAKTNETSDVDFEIDCPHEVLCAEKILPQVFQNLIANSIKFTKDIRRPKVAISSVKVHGAIKVCVEDNGPGIPKDKRETVFKAFERLHDSKIEGLGLGLSMVLKIVEIHGEGVIEIDDSEKLGGARFTFFLRAQE